MREGESKRLLLLGKRTSGVIRSLTFLVVCTLPVLPHGRYERQRPGAGKKGHGAVSVIRSYLIFGSASGFN